MALDPLEAIHLIEFARLLKPRPAAGTVRYWINPGIKNRRTGERIQLETVRLTRGRGTTMTAYRRFLKRLE